MLSFSAVKTDYDERLLRVSPRVVRNIRGRTDAGVIVEYPELQFQITNISSARLLELEAEVNYYLSSGEFAGSDSDLRLEPLRPGANHTFSLFVEPPQEAASAHLVVKARIERWIDRVPATVKLAALFSIVAMLVLQRLIQ